MFNKQINMDYGEAKKIPQKIRMRESAASLPRIDEESSQTEKSYFKHGNSNLKNKLMSKTSLDRLFSINSSNVKIQDE